MNEAPEVGIGPTLGDAGACPEIIHDSQTWLVGWPTQAAKAVLEQLVVQHARKNLNDLKDCMPSTEWEEMKDSLNVQLLGRHWQTWGTLWSASVNGPQGFPLFLLSLLRTHQPKATLKDAETLWLRQNDQARLALTMVVPDFFVLLAESLPVSDENRQVQAAQTRAKILALLAHPTLTA